MQERLAKLAGGIAASRVGAATETEMKESKARVEDAMNATRAAVEEGIIARGSAILDGKAGQQVQPAPSSPKVTLQILPYPWDLDSEAPPGRESLWSPYDRDIPLGSTNTRSSKRTTSRF